MNRPCFSLGVLLSSLAVCLLAVGSANCQTRLDLHTPSCMMCPYSGSTYSGRSHVEQAETASTSDAADDVDYDLDYQPQYDDSSYNYSAETSTSEADEDYSDDDYSDDDYGYSDYDYSDYDSSEQEDDYVESDGASDSKTLPQVDAGSAVNEAYDYSDYDYSDDDYSEYNDAEYNDAEYNEGQYDEAQYDEAQYDDSDYGYTDYEYSGYGYSYDENLTEAGQADAPAEIQGEESPSEAASESNGTSDEYGAFDNYDYEDYFAEVYGEDEVRAEVGESESSDVEASIVANEDVDAFDFFDQETFEPAAPEQDMTQDYDAYDYDASDYDEYEYDYDEYGYDADDYDALAVETENIEAESAADDSSAAALYDLETTYDAAYDEVMAPTVAAPAPETQATETPAVETRDLSATDHCFGGYADPYRSEYRCDLADAYQVDAYESFYHDGADPSASEREAASPVAEHDDANGDEQPGVSEPFVTAAFPQLVEPYLAAAVDRVGAAWRQFSLESLVSRAVTGMASLPVSFADDAKANQLTSIGDYVDCHVDDCHIDAGNCDPNWCEIDCFGPWEPAQPIGSGVSNSADSSLQPTDLQPTDTTAPTLDTAGLDKAKAAIRDLRSRMNAARQSPPLR